MSLASNVWHLIGLLFAVGWFVSPTQGSVSAIIQSEVPAASLGRVSSSLGTVVQGLHPNTIVFSIANSGGVKSFQLIEAPLLPNGKPRKVIVRGGK